MTAVKGMAHSLSLSRARIETAKRMLVRVSSAEHLSPFVDGRRYRNRATPNGQRINVESTKKKRVIRR